MRCGIVVGYSGFTLRSSSIMVNPTFLKVGGSNIARLTDIKPTGYEGLTYFEGSRQTGFNNQITIAVLAKDGSTAIDADTGKDLKWVWHHNKPLASNYGYWTRSGEATEIKPGDTNDYQFKPGEAVWAYVAPGAYTGPKVPETQYSLQNSGEAMLESGTFTLRSSSIGVGAPLSRAVRLTEIKPTGYETLSYFEGSRQTGFNNQITIAILAKDGSTATDADTGKDLKWVWHHNKPLASNHGYWTRSGEATEIKPGDANDYQFKLGEALWAYVAPGAYTGPKVPETQYMLEFPAVEDDNRVTE